MRRDEVKDGHLPLFVSGTILLLMLLLSAYAWHQLPVDALIPVHWGVDGNVDGYAGKAFGLVVLPTIMAVILALVMLLSVLEPRRPHLNQSWSAVRAIWIGLSLFLFAIHSAVLWAALGHPGDPSMFIIAGLGILLCVTGSYMGKVRSNYFVGVRTPWTLSSEVSWSKTNRLGGKFLVVTGVLAIVAGLTLGIEITLFVVTASVLATAAITAAYSYRIWKTDPDRR